MTESQIHKLYREHKLEVLVGYIPKGHENDPFWKNLQTIRYYVFGNGKIKVYNLYNDDLLYHMDSKKITLGSILIGSNQRQWTVISYDEFVATYFDQLLK